MMKVSVVGAGPAGLFFATLLKRGLPSSEVTVYEQNLSNTTYGFGVGFSEGALNFLQKIDSDLYEAILASSEHMKCLTITHQGISIPIFGNDFYGIERIGLLNLLKKRALTSGVHLVENCRIETLHNLKDYDLLVGADGVNSVVRHIFCNNFQPIIKECQNILIWYGTSRISKGIELIFNKTNIGLFIGHTYRYRPDRNTFVIECAPNVWQSAGFDIMPESESRLYCEKIFSEFLNGCPLISNRSFWFTPKIIKMGHWVNNQVTLLGDALKTVHPSIGSGTRAAMQDAVALANACLENPLDVRAALVEFEQSRRPKAEQLQNSALRSIDWYEKINDCLSLSPIEFAYDYMTRTGKIDYDRLREMDPHFIQAYESFCQSKI